MSPLIIIFAIASAIILGALRPLKTVHSGEWIALGGSVLVPALAMIILQGSPTDARGGFDENRNYFIVHMSEALVIAQAAIALFLTVSSRRNGRWATVFAGVGAGLSALLMVIFVFGTIEY